jgi:hypothetical protein
MSTLTRRSMLAPDRHLPQRPDWAKWQSAEEEQPTVFEERIALLETVPTTLARLAALHEYLSESEVGVCLFGSADELMIFFTSMHYAANAFAGLPAPGEFSPGHVAAVARRSRENARENARRDALGQAPALMAARHPAARSYIARRHS